MKDVVKRVGELSRIESTILEQGVIRTLWVMCIPSHTSYIMARQLPDIFNLSQLWACTAMNWLHGDSPPPTSTNTSIYHGHNLLRNSFCNLMAPDNLSRRTLHSPPPPPIDLHHLELWYSDVGFVGWTEYRWLCYCLKVNHQFPLAKLLRLERGYLTIS